MKIFITGACGFIGSHLVEMLVKKNYKVKALTYYNPNNDIGCLKYINPKILDNLEIIQGDVRDNYFIKEASKGYDCIIHLAALIGIPYSYKSVSTYIETNINGTNNILNAVRENSIDKVVITSTSEVYGSAQFIPIKETHPLNAQSPYAASKIAADQLALSYYKSFSTPVTIIRPFNNYGPRQSTRAIIPTIINQILDGNKTLRIGNIYPTRDFTYVEDTSQAFVNVLKNKRSKGEIINVGSNFEISIKDIIEILKNEFGFDFRIKIEKKRKRSISSEVDRLYSSNIKAKKLLNWTPNHGGLLGFKKGLAKTIKWYEKNYKSKKLRSNNYAI